MERNPLLLSIIEDNLNWMPRRHHNRQPAADTHTQLSRNHHQSLPTLTVAEVDGCELRAVDDSACAGIQFGHAYIDLRTHGRSARDRIAKRLKQLATANGIWMPSGTSDTQVWEV